MSTSYLDEQLFTPQQTANLLAISPRTLRRMVQRGEIASIKRGRLRRYRMGDIRDWQHRNIDTNEGSYDA